MTAKYRKYPHNHADLVTVGDREVVFGDGFEYVRGEILVSPEDVEEAVERLTKWYAKRGSVELDHAGSAGAVRLSFSVAVDPLVVTERLTRIGIAASVNHVLKPTWHLTLIGMGLPSPAKPTPWMRAQLKRAASTGRGPVVAVVDTGMCKHPLLPKVSGVGKATEPETTPAAEVLGHGTFVAGLIASECPEADIRMIRAEYGSRESNWFGLITDLDLAKAIEFAMAKLRHIDVLNLSIGGFTHDGQSLLATGAAVATAVRKGIAVVAGSGNDGRRGDPFYPAAEPGVLAVGSLDADGRRSCFSNTGPWVDVMAIGEDVLSTFPPREVTYMAIPEGGTTPCGPAPATPEQTIDFSTGFARWSGTSFASARVAGAIARTRIHH